MEESVPKSVAALEVIKRINFDLIIMIAMLVGAIGMYSNITYLKLGGTAILFGIFAYAVYSLLRQKKYLETKYNLVQKKEDAPNFVDVAGVPKENGDNGDKQPPMPDM